MKIDIHDYRVESGSKFRLGDRPTKVEPVYKSKKEYRDILDDHVKKLSELQEVHYAADQFALLIVLQAMDAAGKDGIVRHVMSGVNPQGCDVYSFKQPTPEELKHDFLWRTNLRLPERGKIAIFNRSYYEDVLVVRVHPELLQPEFRDDKSIWKDRYKSIVDSEKHLHRNGTHVVKFYLHLSKEEQRQRLLARIEEPEKNWKFSLSDIKERDFWDQYAEAYEEAIGATSTEDSPWYVVPADDKKNARLIVSQVILHTLESLKLAYPTTSETRKKELASIEKELKK